MFVIAGSASTHATSPAASARSSAGASLNSIARVVTVPLSVDFEAGYSDDPATAGENVAAVIEAGAVGINLEDGFGSPSLLAEKIGCVKKVAARAGVSLFVNARVDVYLKDLVAEPARVEETLARAARYREAGADGIFVPKVVARGEIRTLAGAILRSRSCSGPAHRHSCREPDNLFRAIAQTDRSGKAGDAGSSGPG